MSLAVAEVDVTNTFFPPVAPNTTSFIAYSLPASPGIWWYSVELDSTHHGTGVSVTKELFSDASFSLASKIMLSVPWSLPTDLYLPHSLFLAHTAQST